MSYKIKLESIKTVKELFDFRDELKADALNFSNLWEKDEYDAKSENMLKTQEANYFIDRVDSQIKYFEKEGVFLTSIKIPTSNEEL